MQVCRFIVQEKKSLIWTVENKRQLSHDILSTLPSYLSVILYFRHVFSFQWLRAQFPCTNNIIYSNWCQIGHILLEQFFYLDLIPESSFSQTVKSLIYNICIQLFNCVQLTVLFIYPFVIFLFLLLLLFLVFLRAHVDSVTSATVVGPLQPAPQ